MKKVKLSSIWSTLQLANKDSRGLMSSKNSMGYNSATVIAKTVVSDVGFLISTSLPAATSNNIILRLTENNYLTNIPGVKTIQGYGQSAGAYKQITSGSTGIVDVFVINGNLCFYVTPQNASGYSALIEVFAISSTKMEASPEVSISYTGKPTGSPLVTLA